MAEFKHLVVAKFKEDVDVEEILKGMEKLVSDIDEVKSFEWGKDVDGEETLRQGYSYVFSMTFEKKEDFIKFVSHPSHAQFSATFSAAIEKIVLLDFPSVLVKQAEPAAVELPPPPVAAEPAAVEQSPLPPPATAEPSPEVSPEAEVAVA